MQEALTPQPGMPVQPGDKAGNGATLICTRDPLGYVISLDVHCWEDHVVKRHPEMADHLDLIRETIEQPQLIQRGLESGSTCYYYRLTGRSILRRSDLYLSLVVNRDDATTSGFVRTIHLLKGLRKGEGEIIWISNP